MKKPFIIKLLLSVVIFSLGCQNTDSQSEVIHHSDQIQWTVVEKESSVRKGQYFSMRILNSPISLTESNLDKIGKLPQYYRDSKLLYIMSLTMLEVDLKQAASATNEPEEMMKRYDRIINNHLDGDVTKYTDRLRNIANNTQFMGELEVNKNEKIIITRSGQKNNYLIRGVYLVLNDSGNWLVSPGHLKSSSLFKDLSSEDFMFND